MQRYPEVLEYFYSLIEMNLPDENDVAVRDPPLSALSGARKVRVREREREREREIQRERERSAIEEGRGKERETPGGSRRPGRSVPWAGAAPSSGYAYTGPSY